MTPDDFDLLIHRYFEGSLSAEEEAAFWAHLKADPAAADRFVEMSELESAVVESMKADDDMPSGVYVAVHGTRRRPRLSLTAKPRPAWPYWVAAGLFIAALSILLRTERMRDRSELAVARPAPIQEVPAPARADLEIRRTQQQEVLRKLEQKGEDLLVARKDAQAKNEEQAQREIDKSFEDLDRLRREEAAKLARIEDVLSRPEPTRVQPAPPPAGPILETVEGDVAWVADAGRPPKAGQTVPAGSGLTTTGTRARVVIKLLDDTRLEVRGDGRLEDLQGTGDQQRCTVTKGTLLASVTKQTGARSVVIVTPHAELTVIGTKFLVQVGADETRLDVEEGKVLNRRLTEKRGVEVAAGHTLTTRKTGALVPKPLPLVRSFQEGLLPTPDYAGTQDTSIGKTSVVPEGSQDLLVVYRESGREVENTALLRWDVSSIPARSRVVSAELSLWITGGLSGPGARAFEVRRRWDEVDATWKLARPGVPWQIAGARGDQDAGTRPLAVIAPTAAGWATYPLNEAGVALVQQWVSVPAANFGIGITKEPPNIWTIGSKEWATVNHRPKLTVRYLPPAK